MVAMLKGFRRSDPSRDIWFLYRLPIPYLTIIDK
jgi:hypothetical protein